MWYLPLSAQLQVAFQGPEFARLCTFHKSDERKMAPEGFGSDFYDFQFYKNFCANYGWVDPRWLLLAMSIDGFNPFSKQRTNYSMWPCFVKILNLPPHLRNRPEFMFMVFLTQGPKAPRSLAPYLDLLVDDLLAMWDPGFPAYDAHLQQNFTCKAALAFVTADEPGSAECRCLRGHQSREGCTYCSHRAVREKDLDKVVFSGAARFLPDDLKPPGTMDQPELKTNRGLVEGQLKWLEAWKAGQSNAALARISDQYGVTGFSPLARLPYFDLAMHSIPDIMHWLENAGTQLVAMFKGERGSSSKVVAYEVAAGNLPPDWDGTQPLPWTVPEDKWPVVEERLCSVLKAPNMQLNPINIWRHPAFIKAAGWVVFFRFLALFVFDGLLQPKMQDAFTKYVHAIQAVLEPLLPTGAGAMERLQEQVVLACCAMELAVPTYEHTLMLVHFPLHIVRALRLFGPCHVHWMFPFERLMSLLKRWVRTRVGPEASIVMQYSRNRGAWQGVAANVFSARPLFKNLQAWEDDGGPGSFDYEPLWMEAGANTIRGGSQRAYGLKGKAGEQLRLCYSGFHEGWAGIMQKFQEGQAVYQRIVGPSRPPLPFKVWLAQSSTAEQLTAEQWSLAQAFGARYHKHTSLHCNGRVVRPYPVDGALVAGAVYSFMVRACFEDQGTYYGRVVSLLEHDLMGCSDETSFEEPTNYLFCQVVWYHQPAVHPDRKHSPYIDMSRAKVDLNRPFVLADQVFMVPVAISGRYAYLLEHEHSKLL